MKVAKAFILLIKIKTILKELIKNKNIILFSLKKKSFY